MGDRNPEQSQVNGTADTNGTDWHTERNAWSSPGPAAFDFRSDVVTTPTPSMLRSIQTCTLLDDVFAEDPTTAHLESTIARLTGHAAALLVLSGTMGNQLAIRTHLAQPPHSVLADARSHIYNWEAGGVSSLSGAFPIQVAPANGHHITLEDVKKHISLPTPNETINIHRAPTRLISLENTLDGSVLPLDTAREISAYARTQDPPIPLHLDGARLWEACASDPSNDPAQHDQVATLKAYAACFDSLSLCFSKGLGAPIGSVLVGSAPFIARARHIRKALGGGMRQTGVIAAPALVAVNETFLGGKLAKSHETARSVGRMWEERGGKLERGVETNMVWFDLAQSGIDAEAFVEAGVREGVKVMGGRCVCHYQIGEEGVRALGRVMDRVLPLEKNGREEGAKGEEKEQRMGEGNEESQERKEEKSDGREVKEIAHHLRQEGEAME